MDLLLGGELRALQRAMDCGREIELDHVYIGGLRVFARTRRAGPAWGVPMVVQLRVERPGLVWLQSFESLEELRRATTPAILPEKRGTFEEIGGVIHEKQ